MHTRRISSWLVGGVASLVLALPALAQKVYTGSAVTINDYSKASPFPSTVKVNSGDVSGNIEKVTVSLNGVTHGYPSDIGVVLVSPTGKKVALMSNAGGQTPLNGINFTLDDGAGSPLPQNTAIQAQSYKPADYSGGGLATFEAGQGGPTGPYSSTLSAFNGDDATGTWSLYVVDQHLINAGSMGSWSLNLWTVPSVSVTNANNTIAVDENGTTTLNVNVASSTVPVNNLTLEASCPDADLTVSGTGGTRQVAISPKSNFYGPSTITLTVKDGVGSATTTVNLNVNFVNQAPSIVLGTNAVKTVVGTLAGPVTATLDDAEIHNGHGESADSLVLSATSSDTNVVTDANVFFGGTGANRTLTIAPKGVATGTATVTITVTDAGGKTASKTVNVTVNPLSGVIYTPFANSTPLPVHNDQTVTANSGITVSGVSGLVGKVAVVLTGITNFIPADMDVRLTKGSQTVFLLQHPATAPATAVNYAQLTFDDAGNGALPSSSSINNTTLVPATALNAFIGTNPNDTWNLYVSNTVTGVSGYITGGWLLKVYPAPTISQIDNQTTKEDTDLSLNFSVASTYGTFTNALQGSRLQVVSSLPGLVTVKDLKFNTNSNTGSFTLSPVANQNSTGDADYPGAGSQPWGPSTISIISEDDSGFYATNKFTLTVSQVNNPPTISFIPKQVTPVDVPVGPFQFTVGSIDHIQANLTVTVASSNQKVLPNNNIVLKAVNQSQGIYSLTLFPTGFQADTSTITVFVSDGTDTSSFSFPFTATAPNFPLFGNISPITINNNDKATPYPATINVSGMPGTVITGVKVTLFDVIDPNPTDLNVLLVGPTGKMVYLMGHAGGGTAYPLNNTTITFDDAATASLPQSAQIESGSYKPTTYTSAPNGGFPSPAPASPYPTTLSSLYGTGGETPNGTWSLYVFDDSPDSRGGAINGGWQISIRTAPVIPAIADQSTTENLPLRVNIPIGDAEPTNNLTITATSGNQTLVPNANLSIAGTGSSRTLTITPGQNQFGSTTITVTAQDDLANTTTRTFNLTVNYQNQPPVIAGTGSNGAIPDQSTSAGVPAAPITFTVTDPDLVSVPSGNNLDTVSVQAYSSDQSLLPDANIGLSKTSTVGDVQNWTLSMTPAGVASGAATVTVVAQDSAGNKTTKTFTLTINSQLAYANTNPITIPVGAPIAETASPYPSVISVSGLNGVIRNTKVTLVGFSHPFPQDVSVVLVSPDNSKKIVLMGKAGGGNSVSGLRLDFEGSSPNTLPQATPLQTGSYQPGNYGAPSFPAPGPGTPFSTSLSDLNGLSPNGDWKLYVIDDTYPDGGSISGGWIITFNLAPVVANIGPQFTRENTALPVTLNLADSDTNPTNLVVTAAVTGTQYPPNLVVPAGLVVSTNLDLTRTLTITPSANLPSAYTITNAPGTNLITVTVKDKSVGDSSATKSFSFPLTVYYQNQAPTVNVSTNYVETTQSGGTVNHSTNDFRISQNSKVVLSFNMSDVDSTVTATNLTVTSSNTGLVPNSGDNIKFDQSIYTAVSQLNTASAVVPVTVIPSTNTYGDTTLTFRLTDASGNTATTSLILHVVHVNQPPVISPSPIVSNGSLSIVAGSSTAAIPFTVSDVETSARDLVVTATSSDQSVVPDANITLGGIGLSQRTIQVTPIGSVAPNTTKQATITVKVTDADGASTTSSFVLIVTPPPVLYYANTGGITIRDDNSAQPYPAPITVNGVLGNVSHVSVTLQGFSHGSPSDVDVLLVHGDKAVMLMSDTGGHTAVNNLQLGFDDSASASLPVLGPVVSGTYKPTDLNLANDVMPGNPASPPYSTTLAAFNGMDPNGTWSLYVDDHTPGDSGAISAGWTLNVTATPTISASWTGQPAPLAIDENPNSSGQPTQGTASFTISDSVVSPTNMVLSYTVDNPSLVSKVDLPSPPTGNGVMTWNGTATIYPALYQNSGSGTNHLTLTITRNDGVKSTVDVPFIVSPVDQPPWISRLGSVSTPAGTPLSFTMLVGDPDTAPPGLSIQVTSDNQSVIASTNCLLYGTTNFIAAMPASSLNTNEVKLTLVPVSVIPADSTANITVAVSDHDSDGHVLKTTTSTFQLTVTKVNHVPTITSIPDQTVIAGSSTTNILFTATDPDDNSSTLSVAASSSDQALVQDANIVLTNPGNGTAPTTLSGPNGQWGVQLTAQPGVTGKAMITLQVTKPGNLKTTESFQVTVRPSRERAFTSTQPIVIRDNNTADPYPAVIPVSGLNGGVSKVKVTLNGFAHGYPQDVSALLVSPNGQKALLMRRAGGYSSVTNLTLTFDQNASTTIPQSSLASGIYKPMDYTTGGPYTFPSPAPAGPYNADLTKLNNTVAGSADGNWSLYVTDDTPSDAGIITSGWSLAITTGPVIQGLQSITTAENSPARVPFTIADDTVDTPSYTFSYSSTNTLLVASSGAVTFSGSGTNYVMTINPVQYASGTTKITVNATNQDGQTATASFILTVTPVNFPPTMTAVADQTIEAGSTVSVPFVYNDIETPQKNLIFTIDSSNPSLLPVSNITSSDDYLHIAPAGALTGSSRVTLTVAEPAADGGLSTHESFLVTVIAGATPVFGNTNAITINDDTAATPYPSTIDVSNVVGHVADVSVTLVGFGHTFPSDVSALLVGPQGQKVVLMSRAGGGVSVSNVRLTLDDNATNSLPQNSGLTNGTFKPSSYESGLTFPTPAPGTPYSTQLSAFSGTSPNGTWSLYVQDDVPTFGGQITGGWILHIITDAPAIAPIQGQVTDENTPLVVPFTLISPVTSPNNLTLFATSSANNPPDLIPAGNLVLGGSGTNRTVTVTPTANEYGTSLITLSVTDGINRSSTSFPLTVNFVNQPPTITGLSDQTLAANQVLQLPFRVSDAETPASNLVVNATSSDSSIGTVALSGTDTARTLIFRPSGTQGSTTLSVTAFDGQLTTTNSLVVTVTPAVFPTIAPIADQTIYEGNTLLVNVSISNTTATNLVVAGSSSNSNLVASVTIGGSGTSRTALVTLVPYANSDLFGPAVITITATDQNGTGSTSFNLNVIAVNNPPVLGRIAEQGTTMNTPLRLPLVVSDPDTALKDLSFVGSSSNPSLISGVTFQNSGSNVVAIITPATNQTGTASVTIAVNDGTTTVSQSFNLSVTAPPVLGPIADQTATLGASVSIPLVVSDADTPLTNLTFTASGYSGPLVQTVTFAKTASNVVATVTAATNRFGTTPMTISASDGTSTASQTFTFTVSVAPVLGPIADQHTTMDTPLTLKLDVSDIETPLTNLTFTGTPDTYALVSGVTFQNDGTNVTATITPVTGRFGTAAITIAVSDGTTTVSQNFNLTITAPPVLAAIPDQTTPLNVPLTLTLTVSDFDTPLTNLTFTGQAGSTALVTGISFSNNGKKVTTIITPAANRHGTTTVTINVSDGTSTTSQTFNLSITAPPTLGPIAAQTTVTNVPVSVKLDVSDADTPISDLAFTGVATDTNLVKGISFTNDGTNVVATITPSSTQTGSTTVTISVSDGTSAFSQNFTFTVGTASPPSLKPSLNLSNGSLGIGFTGVPNATYVLQSSSDLVTWTTVATATADATGAVNFNVTIDTSTPFQFYRVRSQ